MTRARDIAIIGIGCRAPGAEDYGAFWNLLLNGKVGVGSRPPERHLRSQVWDEEAIAQLTDASSAGGWLEAVDQFDDRLFQIAGREARAIDPQHRLLLEQSWCSLQDAGLDPRRPGTSSVGVFIGLTSFDYALLGYEQGAAVGPYWAIGGALCLASNRISHALGFDGPSMTVDAACASSLVAIHLACRSLAAGESNLALAGGANLVLTPSVNASFQSARMLSPTGRCRPFDARADGYVRSEGVGIVVLRRLEDALTAGDPIHAVIVASAVNQDGRTRGITVPSASKQERLIRTCWKMAELAPDDIAFVEAHGTGTPTGDPIEIEALSKAVESRALDHEPCWVGSLKGNIGHAEAAAGVLSVIKAALALSKRVLPPHVGVSEPIEGLAGTTSQLQLAKACVKLGVSQPSNAPLYGGVSAFGFGGTNCHVLLRAPPVAAATPLNLPFAVTLSAHEENALQSLCVDWAVFLETASPEATEAAGRFSMRAFSGERLRVAAFGETPGALAQSLRQTAAEPKLSGKRSAILRIVPTEVVDLLSERARYRVAATRAAEGIDAAETCVCEEIEALVRSLFSDAVSSEETRSGDKTLIAIGNEDASADMYEIGADPASTLPLLLNLWRAGIAANAAPLVSGSMVRPLRLPGYRFARRRHWLKHLPLPGLAIASREAGPQTVLLRFGASYLSEHLIFGEAVVPGASILMEVLQAVQARLPGNIELQDVRFESVLGAQEAARGVYLFVWTCSANLLSFELVSASREPSIRYASGIVFAREA